MIPCHPIPAFALSSVMARVYPCRALTCEGDAISAGRSPASEASPFPPLPGAEAQQQRRKWFLPGLRGVNQRVEHGAQRRRMEGDLCTVQELPK